MRQTFVDCILEWAGKRGFGDVRSQEIIRRFDGLTKGFEAVGHTTTDAYTMAQARVFAEVAQATHDKARQAAKALQVQAANNARIQQAVTRNIATGLFLLDGKKASPGVVVARSAISLIEDDPRFNGLAYSTRKETIRGTLFATMGDVLQKIRKGAFGRQVGKVHLDNIVHEIHGKSTGDALAAAFAKAYKKTQELSVDMFNQAGGLMNKLKTFHLPQLQSAARIMKAGEQAWIDAHKKALDWNAMRWPDGSPILPSEHDDILKEVFQTLTTAGGNKINPAKFQGRGHAVGNALEKHRFLLYKDAQSWLDVHNAFGDGNPFDVMMHHLENMAHKIALVETFGPNPEVAASNLHGLVLQAASKISGKARIDAEGVLKNKFDPMFKVVTRQNPMDPDSTMGAIAMGVSHILTSAQLGAASLLAIPGDFMQSIVVRKFDGMNAFGGVGFYLKAMLTDQAFSREMAQQAGFVFDEVVHTNYAMQRWTGIATYGPAITRHISDAIMRASLMAPHTKAARWANQAEFMGMFARNTNVAYKDLPFVEVLKRYGVSDAEWSKFVSTVKPYTHGGRVNFLRPIDLVNSSRPDHALYQKLQGLIFEESRKMVPESTIEATTYMRGNTRPDTLPGALLHSFSMYKNFPISAQMLYGRLAMTSPSIKGRLGLIAGMGAGMIGVGALGVQMREISKGRDLQPMDDWSFWGRALMAGGGLSIWGDMLFSGVNDYGRNAAEAFAGPFAGLLEDSANLVAGDGFAWIEALDRNDNFTSNTFQRMFEFAKRYTPGTNIWWARLALEREVWDRIEELADPNAYAKRKRRADSQRENVGTGSWWPSGAMLPGGSQGRGATF